METGVVTRETPKIEVIAARLSIGAAAATLVLLASLHVLSPEFDPSFRMVSEYALSQYGWVLSLMFLAWGISAWALALTLWSQVNTRAGKVGLWLLVIAGLGEAMACVFDITHDLGHSIAGVLGMGSFPIAAMVLSVSLGRLPTWREIAAPLAGEPELDQRRPAGSNPGADDGASRPGLWRPLASARAGATANGGAWIRWMGRPANRPLQLLVGGYCCLAGAEAG